MATTTIHPEVRREDLLRIEQLAEQVQELLEDAYRKLVTVEELIAARKLESRFDDPDFGHKAHVLVNEMRNVESRPVLTAALAASELMLAACNAPCENGDPQTSPWLDGRQQS
jgi:hypothetical protein